MSGALAIARREFASMFRTPVGWLLCALFLLLAGFVFAFGSLRPGEPASMRDFFTLSNWLLMLVCPAISMRLFAEERRSGTIERLLTTPVTDAGVVAGKILGALAFLCVMLALSLVYPATLLAISPASVGPIVAGYTGLALLGLFYISLGALCSALTQSQVTAFVVALFAIQALRIVAAQAPLLLDPPLGAAIASLSVERRLADFGRGVIDLSHVVYFASLSAWLACLGVVALGSRRWR